MTSCIFLFEIINVVILDPKMFLSIPASTVYAAAVINAYVMKRFWLMV